MDQLAQEALQEIENGPNFENFLEEREDSGTAENEGEALNPRDNSDDEEMQTQKNNDQYRNKTMFKVTSKSPMGVSSAGKSILGGQNSNNRNASSLNRQMVGRFSTPNINNVAQTGKLNEAKILTNKLMGFKLNTNKVTIRNINGQRIVQESQDDLNQQIMNSESIRHSTGKNGLTRRLSKPNMLRGSLDKVNSVNLLDQNQGLDGAASSNYLDLADIMKIHREEKEKDLKLKQEQALKKEAERK